MELSTGAGVAANFIAESGVLDSPFVLVDVGARDGIHIRWRPFESAMEVYGFDAIADIQAPNERHRYFKLALGNYDGESLFHVPDNLYEARVSPDGTQKVPIAKIDTLWAREKLPLADFIKIDCEGHEPDILKGADEYLAASNILGADIETNFHVSPTLPFSHFAEIHAPLLKQRLLVANFAFESAAGKSILPWCGTCNVLFARHFVNERNHSNCYAMRPPDPNPSPDAILKTIALLDVYALKAPAITLVREFRDVISSRLDPNTVYKKLIVSDPIPSLVIDRYLPHLGLGLWTRAKRFAYRLPG